jgi:hypothetical protein
MATAVGTARGTEQLLRIYEYRECGADGYPFAWHQCPDCDLCDSDCDTCCANRSAKALVRDLAGHRCIRCRHPYKVGQAYARGGWSPCDEQCRHKGPARYRPSWSEYGEGMGADAGDLDVWSKQTATPPDASAGEVVSGGIDIEARWRILTVHHLTGAKQDLRWWNLAALCQRCHLQIQGKVRMEQVYPHEHSDWFKPYAAGYYAATYLGEDLTRKQTEIRLRQLLDLECRS